MGTIEPLSKSATIFLLHGSELVVLVFGVLLAIGLIGELVFDKTKNVKKRLYRACEILVIIGVAGELAGDGGMFVFADRLQAISDHEIAVLNRQAKQFERDAETARHGIAKANEKAEAEHLARLRIEQRIAGRRLTRVQQSAIASELSQFTHESARISSYGGDSEAAQFSQQLAAVLGLANWSPFVPDTVMTFGPPVSGVMVEATEDARSKRAAERLVAALLRQEIVASKSPRIDDAPICRVRIIVGQEPK